MLAQRSAGSGCRRHETSLLRDELEFKQRSENRVRAAKDYNARLRRYNKRTSSFTDDSSRCSFRQSCRVGAGRFWLCVVSLGSSPLIVRRVDTAVLRRERGEN